MVWIGHDGENFCFDNELPRHREFVHSFSLASRPVTCGEYLEFIEDDGYRRSELWLSMGWQVACDECWSAPLYWTDETGKWQQFTLSGLRDVSPSEPVCHVSYFEADAFARWAGARLPTEVEWEIASEGIATKGNFACQLTKHGDSIHPREIPDNHDVPSRMFGDVWEWTSSPYTAYAGFTPAAGALGEYNGKFMCNQYVLRGGSCATSQDHIRRTYRNFFTPEARWQFSGIRLAK